MNECLFDSCNWCSTLSKWLYNTRGCIYEGKNSCWYGRLSKLIYLAAMSRCLHWENCEEKIAGWENNNCCTVRTKGIKKMKHSARWTFPFCSSTLHPYNISELDVTVQFHAHQLIVSGCPLPPVWLGSGCPGETAMLHMPTRLAHLTLPARPAWPASGVPSDLQASLPVQPGLPHLPVQPVLCLPSWTRLFHLLIPAGLFLVDCPVPAHQPDLARMLVNLTLGLLLTQPSLVLLQVQAGITHLLTCPNLFLLREDGDTVSVCKTIFSFTSWSSWAHCFTALLFSL